MRKLLPINEKNLEVMDKGTGSIPILILPGMASSFVDWLEIIECLSRENRVIVFHRPGLGRSVIHNEERTTEAVCREIIELLEALQVDGKVLLAGHSYGGLCAQHFVKLHPDRSAGLVLIDSTSVHFEELDKLHLPVMDEEANDEVWLARCREYAAMDRGRLMEKVKPALTPKQKLLPAGLQKELLEFQVNPGLYQAMASEIENWKEDARRIRELGKFPELPLAVIGRDKEYNIERGVRGGLPEEEMIQFEEAWHNLIKEQALLAESSILVFAERASHSIHVDRGGLISDVISNLAKSIRQVKV
ncbi:alpha/beta fold hydrolase [Peribacillus sp. SCS-37]|uniref:alpha/beta fold hydrolase n=1 Tax=Paraperibacillus esterisolvens TaxID=3115296 RepID=UPI0039068B12